MNQHQDKPAPKAGATYDTIKSGSGTARDLDPGRYEAVIILATLQDKNDSGQSLRLNLVLCDESIVNNDLPTWFKLYRADDSLNEFGVQMWKATLARLGYQDVPEAELPQLLAQITADRPGVVVKVGYKTDKGRTFQRVDIEGTCDSDVIARYKEAHDVEAPY
jgi:hypothetical protein